MGERIFLRSIAMGTDEIRFQIMTSRSKAAALQMEALRQGIRSEAEKRAIPYGAFIPVEKSRTCGGRTQSHLLQRGRPDQCVTAAWYRGNSRVNSWAIFPTISRPHATASSLSMVPVSCKSKGLVSSASLIYPDSASLHG